MATKKLSAGELFPAIEVSKFGGGSLVLGKPLRDNTDWQLVVVYRGKHCPLCTKYLAQLEKLKNDFFEAGVDIMIVSADPEEKVKVQVQEKLNLSLNTGIDLSIDQMKDLGLYISHPRSSQETDRPFAEPGVFVVNAEGKLHVVDISNNPFVRPDLEKLLSGIQWIRDPKNDYPIRGTYN